MSRPGFLSARATLIAASLAFAACDSNAASRRAAAGDITAFVAARGPGWVRLEPGNMPLVIVVPHDGQVAPDELPDRRCESCVAGEDTDTSLMAALIADALERRTGRRPYVVTNLLDREKFDANRERIEATGGDAKVMPVWERWQERIDSAKAGALTANPRALLIDLHRHAHDEQRIELGYAIVSGNLFLLEGRLSNATLTSTIGGLAASLSPEERVALVRGPRALGTLLADAGYPALPSSTMPVAKHGEAYFDGGFNVVQHGSRNGGPVDAVQVELNEEGILDSSASRARFAETFATVLERFLAERYRWTAK